MNEMPHRLDWWTFTQFVDGFLGNEKATNRRMHCNYLGGSRLLIHKLVKTIKAVYKHEMKRTKIIGPKDDFFRTYINSQNTSV